MRFKIHILLFFITLINIAWGIPKDPNEEHEGWMKYSLPDKITVFMKKKQPLDYNMMGSFNSKSSSNLKNSLSMQGNEGNAVHEKILQQIIELVGKKRSAMCKVNPGGVWKLNLSVGIDGIIKIVEIKTQATITVEVQC